MLNLSSPRALAVKAVSYATGYSYGRSGGTTTVSMRAWPDFACNCWNSGYLRGREDYVREDGIVINERASMRMGLRMAGVGAGLRKQLWPSL